MDPRFELARQGESAVLHIRGDLDIATEDAAVGIVSSVLAADPPPAVLFLDLTEVVFMDSSGLRALLRMHNRHGSSVRLGPVSIVVERLLALTGTAEVFGSDGDAKA